MQVFLKWIWRTLLNVFLTSSPVSCTLSKMSNSCLRTLFYAAKAFNLFECDSRTFWWAKMFRGLKISLIQSVGKYKPQFSATNSLGGDINFLFIIHFWSGK